MAGFTSSWLDLREAADRAARAESLVHRLRRVLTATASWNVIDLGAGTGANLRYLGPRLRGRQSWRLIDHDRTLLEAARVRLAGWSDATGARYELMDDTLLVRGRRFECETRVEVADLAADLSGLVIGQGSLVTASALLDLVSVSWLQQLTAQCRDAAATALFALTYDGRIELMPAEPEDGLIRSLVNQHQRTDKGFGPALGPLAVKSASQAFRAAGYRVRFARSDWRLGPSGAQLQCALFDGWAAAAAEMAADQRNRIESWRNRRHTHVQRGVSRTTVGHIDMLAWLPQS